ncbi:hypothetical protein pb186bvf_006448 [Paramecium bursaria]
MPKGQGGMVEPLDAEGSSHIREDSAVANYVATRTGDELQEQVTNLLASNYEEVKDTAQIQIDYIYAPQPGEQINKQIKFVIRFLYLLHQIFFNVLDLNLLSILCT